VQVGRKQLQKKGQLECDSGSKDKEEVPDIQATWSTAKRKDNQLHAVNTLFRLITFL